MSIFRNDTLGSWTRGGQAIVHNIRMTTQVFKQTVLAGLILWLMGIGAYAYEVSGQYSRQLLMRIAEAWFQVYVVSSPTSAIVFTSPSGHQFWTTAIDLLRSGIARRTLAILEHDLIEGAILSGGLTLLALGFAWYCFTLFGRLLGSNHYLRGAKFATPRQLRRLLQHEAKGCLTVGGVQLPAAFEPEHILVSGAPGTGKTNIINGMLEGVRKDGRRAIIYDIAGTYVERFYRPGKDIILNPFDERTALWSPWFDVPSEHHYDQMAEAIIPDIGNDPFWSKAARGTLVAVMRALARQDRMLVSVLLGIITRSGLKILSAFVEKTEGAAFVSQEGERTSASIQAHLASYLRSFRYLDDTRNGLSIRDWVTEEADDSWLFINVRPDALPTLRPLISVWLDIAISAIMSMPPDQHRRLFCVIDELPTLHRLPSLSDFLARARKYGGCGILGFQSYPQLEATYGVHEAAALTGNCSTWIALRANDQPTARHVSENLGQADQIEANEGMSYGVNDMRDGVNLSRMQVTRPLVMPTEIVNLPNLVGYLRLGRNFPVIRFQDFYRDSKDGQPAFLISRAAPVRLEPEDDESFEEAEVEPVHYDPHSQDMQETSPRPASRSSGNSIRQRSRLHGPWKPSTPA